MNVPTFIFPALAGLGAIALCSCSAVKTTATKVGDASRKSMAALGEGAQKTADKFGNLLPSRVKVVDVREDDLKDRPLGQQQALAYEEKKRHSFWFFSGPVNFDEPTLPDTEDEMTGSLLPPLED